MVHGYGPPQAERNIMKKLIAAVVAAIAIAFGLSGCEDSGAIPPDHGPQGVIFMPMPGNPVGFPIFI
ncbi:hypothetical protein X816_gp57 [Mycobacterium phage Jovo]|uniref:Uncharacterized protein n=3 Tax=Benedictvirus TaxID=2946819 RepID=V5RB07_9CAUD|nr:hypothetical protein X823_gp59 [Mycobacterium phage Conspiracy]YP_008859059.1 hypothetical protein X816_gp57 [Mycobacterium phage Jovo]AHB29643.1 hypothetical protein CONSPIRACY_34 [Mycobacterium phage Conspiracy]AHB31900.1 hypothetical protein JOVO_34 [Mycobacterium phage Jovo]WNM67850.1 hypothetical protein SEA_DISCOKNOWIUM_34 [Mycobacterium phage Discoknowium]